MFVFEWDRAKAASNRRKHGVDFKLAATVFRDQFMSSIPDEEHSDAEERWVTVGEAKNGQLLTVCHVWREAADHELVRIISARPVSPRERRQFESGT